MDSGNCFHCGSADHWSGECPHKLAGLTREQARQAEGNLPRGPARRERASTNQPAAPRAKDHATELREELEQLYRRASQIQLELAEILATSKARIVMSKLLANAQKATKDQEDDDEE